ncbi:MAG: LacI family DNA-binding transcriptional regulator [Pelomonas sp.]|nr:LacI family DNA-binding transcriptional regulator [Roseateles sp.]
MNSKRSSSPLTTARGRKVATIADVAEMAGVSPMTVSRVVNGETNVRPATRDRVTAAIAALHYTPNQAARGLAGGQLIRIGVLYSNPSAGYLNEFLVGLLNKASLAHVQLVVQKCEADEHEREVAEELIANGIDGLILPPPFCDSRVLIEQMMAGGVPSVAVASGQPDPRLSAVSIDDREAAYEMTRHLLSLGHQRVGFIVGHPNQTASARRLDGYRAAMADAGHPVDPSLLVQGMFNYRSGLDAAEILLGQEHRPTAVFASNDDMAAATVAIAHRMGLDVPGDLTVAGFDDAPLATTIWPELSTVRQPIKAMAEAAVDMLVRQIRAIRDGVEGGREQILMDFALIRRQSDAAPRLRPSALPPRPQP